MEQYIRGLSSYQSHVEEKYNLLLAHFQHIVIQSQQHEGNMQVKDEEIKFLKGLARH